VGYRLHGTSALLYQLLEPNNPYFFASFHGAILIAIGYLIQVDLYPVDR
jgi:hypothetical protein